MGGTRSPEGQKACGLTINEKKIFPHSEWGSERDSNPVNVRLHLVLLIFRQYNISEKQNCQLTTNFAKDFPFEKEMSTQTANLYICLPTHKEERRGINVLCNDAVSF
jgi:hypothetical protein